VRCAEACASSGGGLLGLRAEAAPSAIVMRCRRSAEGVRGPFRVLPAGGGWGSRPSPPGRAGGSSPAEAAMAGAECNPSVLILTKDPRTVDDEDGTLGFLTATFRKGVQPLLAVAQIATQQQFLLEKVESLGPGA